MREWSGFSFLEAILNDISSSQPAKAVRMGERVEELEGLASESADDLDGRKRESKKKVGGAQETAWTMISSRSGVPALRPPIPALPR